MHHRVFGAGGGDGLIQDRVPLCEVAHGAEGAWLALTVSPGRGEAGDAVVLEHRKQCFSASWP